MFSRTTASPSESGVVAFMTSTLSCDDWNSDSNWPASLVASFLCGPPDQPPAPPTYLIEMCACTARSRAEPLRESSVRRSAGARCPKAESIAKLMVTIEKRFSSSIRMAIEAQWKAISNLLTISRAPVGVHERLTSAGPRIVLRPHSQTRQLGNYMNSQRRRRRRRV